MLKKTISLLAISLFVLTIFGSAFIFAQDGNVVLNGVTPIKNERYVAVTFLSGIEYWLPVRRGMNDAAKLLGVKLDYQGTAKYDANEEVQVIDQIIATKPAGLIISAINPESIKPSIDKAVKLGIPVVTFDCDSPISSRPTFLGGDNYKIGQKAGELMAQLIGENKKVACITTIGQDNMNQRYRGFMDKVEQEYGMELVRVGEEGGSYDATAARVAEFIQAVPDLEGVFVTGSMAPGAVRAIEEAGKLDQVKVIAMDADQATMELIKEGKIAYTLVQGGYHMGFWAVMMTYMWAHDVVKPLPDWQKAGISPLPSFVDTGVMVVTKENVDEFAHLNDL